MQSPAPLSIFRIIVIYTCIYFFFLSTMFFIICFLVNSIKTTKTCIETQHFSICSYYFFSLLLFFFFFLFIIQVYVEIFFFKLNDWFNLDWIRKNIREVYITTSLFFFLSLFLFYFVLETRVACVVLCDT